MGFEKEEHIYMPKQNEVKKYPKVGRTRDEHIYKRSYSLDVKLSPYEKELIEKTYRELNFNSMSSYVRDKIFGPKTKFIDNYLDDKFKWKILTEKLFSDLNRIGVNLNQMAKKINSKKDFSKQDKDLIFKIFVKYADELSSIRKEIQDDLGK